MTTPTPLPHAVAIQMCSDFDEGSQSCGDPNHSPESCTCLKLSRAWRKMESDLAAAQEWREAVLNELIVAHIYTKEHDTNPRKAIQDAITWNCQVALDPAVSSDAQKLIAVAQEARERAERGYRCFHCKQVFTDESLAREHFGETTETMARCMALLEAGSAGGPHSPFPPVVLALERAQRAEERAAACELVAKGKLWLWKNFVDGRPEYWAFDNPFPINLDNGDPQTLGEPCGYALFKPSRVGRTDVSDEEVLRRMDAAIAARAK